MDFSSENKLAFKDKSFSCTFEITMEIIGGKWKPLILWHLGTKGTLRFSELRKIMPQITPKMLTQQLRELEADHLILRTVYPVVPPKVEYDLTDIGNDLMPIIKSMHHWGNGYYSNYISTIE